MAAAGEYGVAKKRVPAAGLSGKGVRGKTTPPTALRAVPPPRSGEGWRPSSSASAFVSFRPERSAEPEPRDRRGSMVTTPPPSPHARRHLPVNGGGSRPRGCQARGAGRIKAVVPPLRSGGGGPCTARWRGRHSATRRRNDKVVASETTPPRTCGPTLPLQGGVLYLTNPPLRIVGCNHDGSALDHQSPGGRDFHF
jgi:hypothetical protein